MNWILLVIYLIGIPIAGYISIRFDPPPRQGDWGENQSAAEVGMVTVMIGAMWPIILPFILAYYFFRAIGRLAGQRD